ncbi:putative DNA methylase, partial [Candidatus Hakubella thermalkaliphila]
PYAGNVNYSELSDFFYVWLRLLLVENYKEFAPELTPKAEEIIENPTRGKTSQDFEEGLTQVFQQCNRVLKDDGLLAFTFHHAEGSAWEALLRAVCNAGYAIESVYPIHGESESSLHLLDKR